MAPKLSKLVGTDADTRILGLTSAVACAYWVYSVVKGPRVKRQADEIFFVVGEKNEQKKKVQINKEFLASLKRILKIMLPSIWSPEAGYLVLIALSLVLRSLCDIWMIHNGTLVESCIISVDLPGFKKNLGDFFKAMPAISMVNSMLKLGLHELKLRFRTRLSNHLYRSYMQGFTYYKMNNLDNRISNVDQVLTQDVVKFCDSLVDLYSNICKPILDILIYVQRLSQGIGGAGPTVMMTYLVLSGILLTRLRRPIGRLTVSEQKLEGEFRYVNSRLITNAEEVAFYVGNNRERKSIDSSLGRLVRHIRKFIDFRFNMGFIDNIIAKYFAICVGFCVVAYPYLSPTSSVAHLPYQARIEDYYTNGRMLVKLGEAIGRLVLAGRELTRLAGFTTRVQELMEVLNDLNKGSGKVINEDRVIRFDKVPLVTPNGDVLVNELNFEVKSGMNVLVCGPNGCGKSSLFRILGELWPVFCGTLTKPGPGKLFYIPQRPYMTLGTLRDQVIYPDMHSEMAGKGIADEDLVDLLRKVQLQYILQREGGWDAVADWMDVLSGGEKQRIAMARVFYHKPQFAILDECTSAVSVDVEDTMYQYCREVGITLFTVSHRKSLWKHHEYYLHMDGRGSFEYKPILPETKEFGS